MKLTNRVTGCTKVLQNIEVKAEETANSLHFYLDRREDGQHIDMRELPVLASRMLSGVVVHGDLTVGIDDYGVIHIYK